MRQLTTLSLLLFSLLASAQITLKKTAAGTNVRMRCCASPSANHPLYVLDGTIIDSTAFSSINPNDIESIQVLKGSSATALYGLNANNGAILITTRKPAQRIITFIHNVSGRPLPGITLTRLGENQLVITSDAQGRASIPLTGDASQTWEATRDDLCRYSFRENEIPDSLKMEKRSGYMDTVVVTAYPHYRSVCYSFGCGLKCSVSHRYVQAEVPSGAQQPAVYPNPVRGGASVQIRLKEPFTGTIRLLGSGGQLLRSTRIEDSNKGTLSYSMPATAAGIYHLQLIQKTGSVLLTEKLILQ